MEAVGIHPILFYIRRRQMTIADRAACRSVYTLCTESERMTGAIRMVRWLDKDVVNEL